jgi:hypothetical protein
MDAGQSNENPSARAWKRRRRSHLPSPRSRVVKVRLSEQEYGLLSAAAEREGLANGAYAAQMALAVARRVNAPEYPVLRELLAALMHAAGQVRRIGVNFNQAVAATHSTGELSAVLGLYAEAAHRTIGRLDDIADEVRRRLP